MCMHIAQLISGIGLLLSLLVVIACLVVHDRRFCNTNFANDPTVENSVALDTK